jgi:peptidoglycan/LPS O-acetylase OafA/YrhL
VRLTQQPVNGVAWSLVVEVAFYVMIAVLLTVLKKRPVLTCLIEMALVVAVIATARNFPIDRFMLNWFLFAASVAYLPLLIIGQAIWLWHSKRASATVAATMAALAWLVFIFAMRRIHTQFLPGSNSYGVSAMFAAAIVLTAVVNEHRIRLPRWLAAVSVVSYSVYLIHGPLTVMVMDKLAPSMPFTLHLIVALAVLAVCSLLLWRLVEVPSQALARRLTRRPARPASSE